MQYRLHFSAYALRCDKHSGEAVLWDSIGFCLSESGEIAEAGWVWNSSTISILDSGCVLVSYQYYTLVFCSSSVTNDHTIHRKLIPTSKHHTMDGIEYTWINVAELVVVRTGLCIGNSRINAGLHLISLLWSGGFIGIDLPGWYVHIHISICGLHYSWNAEKLMPMGWDMHPLL